MLSQTLFFSRLFLSVLLHPFPRASNQHIEKFCGIFHKIPSKQWSQILWNRTQGKKMRVRGLSRHFIAMSTAAFMVAVLGIKSLLSHVVRSCSSSVNFISVVFLCLLNTFLKTIASCLSYILKCYKLTRDINQMFHNIL